jgi:perosamine synthetase
MSKQSVLKVPFHKVAVGEEEVRAVAEVIRSGWLTTGPRTAEFERAFAGYVGAKHAVAVATGTAALHLALEAFGIGDGDEVLLPATTFTATAEAVTYLRARPVLVDVDAATLNLSVEDAVRRVTPRTRAVIPVHLGGQPCDLDEIHDLAKAHGLRVVEDAAHGLPSEYKGWRVGAISEITTFSFYATKTVTTGEGGMITTGDDEIARRTRLKRLHGISSDGWERSEKDDPAHYEVRESGFKYNLTDMLAAMGLVQLGKCDATYAARRRIAGIYFREFAGLEGVELPAVLPDRSSSWHLYMIRLRGPCLRTQRNQFMAELAEMGVGTSVHFIPLHLQPFYQREFGYRAGDFPVAEREYQRCISLPIYPTMTDDEIGQVVAAVSSVALRAAR